MCWRKVWQDGRLRAVKWMRPAKSILALVGGPAQRVRRFGGRYCKCGDRAAEGLLMERDAGHGSCNAAGLRVKKSRVKKRQQPAAPVMPCLCRAAARDRSGDESNETQPTAVGTRDSKKQRPCSLLGAKRVRGARGRGWAVKDVVVPLGVAGRDVGDESMMRAARSRDAMERCPLQWTACWRYSSYSGYKPKPISLYSTLAVARLGCIERGL